MRCLSIADAMREQGAEVFFAVADENPVALLDERGYEVKVLSSDWQDLEGELPKLLSLLQEEKAEGILVDHYGATESYLKSLQQVIPVTYLDDLNDIKVVENRRICYGAYYEDFDYLSKNAGSKTEFLLGPSYVPLRGVFQENHKKQIRGQVETLLIMSGGSDPMGIIKKLLGRLPLANYQKVIAICGAFCEDYAALVETYKQMPQVELVKATSHIETYMEQADVAISAAGTTLYELCAMGTPTISYVLADNQIPNARAFAKMGIIPWVGDARTEDVTTNILQLLAGKYTEQTYRKQQSERMQQLVDGKGAKRIAEKMIG